MLNFLTIFGFIMAAFSVYYIPQVITLTVAGIADGASAMNFPVNRTDFKIYRNVTNDINVFVLDGDRRPVDLSTMVPKLNIINNDEIVYTTQLDIIDATRALCKFSINALDSASLDDGYVRFTITVTHETGSETMLYTDRAYGVHGYAEVLDGPVPRPSEAILIDDFINRDGRTVSGSFPGSMTAGHSDGVHTVAFYFDDFTGSVIIEGSIEDQPSTTDIEWFPIETFVVYNQVDTISKTFTAQLRWVRFVYVAASGTVTKILFKN